MSMLVTDYSEMPGVGQSERKALIPAQAKWFFLVCVMLSECRARARERRLLQQMSGRERWDIGISSTDASIEINKQSWQK